MSARGEPHSMTSAANQGQTGNGCMTVARALDEWFQSRTSTIGPNTERDYRLAIQHQLKPFKFSSALVEDTAFVRSNYRAEDVTELVRERHLGGPARKIDVDDFRVLGNLPLTRLDDVLINSMRQSLLEEGLSVKRVNNLMAPLRGAVERQVKLKRLSLNPFELVMPLKKCLPRLANDRHIGTDQLLDAPLPDSGLAEFVAAEGDPDPLTTNELAAILTKLDRAMANQVLFACWTGLRTGELIALRVSDLQLDQNRFLVRRSLSRGVLKTTKTDKQRWVHLLAPARSALEAQLALLGAPDGWVFPNPFTRMRWANDSKITRRWRKALRLAGVRYRRPYQTRHTYASMMLSAGENPLYVAQQMGHADWSMLVRVYGRWMPSATNQPAGNLVASANAATWPVLIGLCD